MPAFAYFHAKLVILVAIVVQIVAVLAYTIAPVYWAQATARFLAGVCQVFFSIYLPVWIDFFAPKEKRVRWMTLLLIAVPSGVISGYLCAALVVSWGMTWKLAFYIQIVMLVPLFIGFLFVKTANIDTKYKQH